MYAENKLIDFLNSLDTACDLDKTEAEAVDMLPLNMVNNVAPPSDSVIQICSVVKELRDVLLELSASIGVYTSALGTDELRIAMHSFNSKAFAQF